MQLILLTAIIMAAGPCPARAAALPLELNAPPHPPVPHTQPGPFRPAPSAHDERRGGQRAPGERRAAPRHEGTPSHRVRVERHGQGFHAEAQVHSESASSGVVRSGRQTAFYQPDSERETDREEGLSGWFMIGGGLVIVVAAGWVLRASTRRWYRPTTEPDPPISR